MTTERCNRLSTTVYVIVYAAVVNKHSVFFHFDTSFSKETRQGAVSFWLVGTAETMRPSAGFFIFLLSEGAAVKGCSFCMGGVLSRKGRPKKYPLPFSPGLRSRGGKRRGGILIPGTIPASGDTAHCNNKAERETAAHYINNYNTGVHPAETFSEKTGGGYLSLRTSTRTYPAHQAKDDNNNVKVRPLAICSAHGMGSRPQASRRLPHLRTANQLFPPAIKL